MSPASFKYPMGRYFSPHMVQQTGRTTERAAWCLLRSLCATQPASASPGRVRCALMPQPKRKSYKATSQASWRAKCTEAHMPSMSSTCARKCGCITLSGLSVAMISAPKACKWICAPRAETGAEKPPAWPAAGAERPPASDIHQGMPRLDCSKEARQSLESRTCPKVISAGTGNGTCKQTSVSEITLSREVFRGSPVLSPQFTSIAPAEHRMAGKALGKGKAPLASK